MEVAVVKVTIYTEALDEKGKRMLRKIVKHRCTDYICEGSCQYAEGRWRNGAWYTYCKLFESGCRMKLDVNKVVNRKLRLSKKSDCS